MKIKYLGVGLTIGGLVGLIITAITHKPFVFGAITLFIMMYGMFLASLSHLNSKEKSAHLNGGGKGGEGE